MGRWRLCSLVWTLAAWLSACVPRTEEVNQTELYFKKTLAEFEEAVPRPNACSVGAHWWREGYIVNLTGWAEEAGLRRGDLIRSVAGVQVNTTQDISRALRGVSPGGPLLLGVVRGGQAVTITLPCKHSEERWAVAREALTAGANGRWDECIEESKKATDLAAYKTKSSAYLLWEFKCRFGKNASMGKRNELAEANLLYQVNLLWLRESQYVPKGIDAVRGSVVGNIRWLKTAGFPSLASDLELLLHSAEEKASAAQRHTQPSTPQR